jgi:hypothetical protein
MRLVNVQTSVSAVGLALRSTMPSLYISAQSTTFPCLYICGGDGVGGAVGAASAAAGVPEGPRSAPDTEWGQRSAALQNLGKDRGAASPHRLEDWSFAQTCSITSTAPSSSRGRTSLQLRAVEVRRCAGAFTLMRSSSALAEIPLRF